MILFACSSDFLNTRDLLEDLWTHVQSSWAGINVGQGLHGGNSLKGTSSNTYIAQDFTARTTYIVEFWFRCDDDGGSSTPTDLVQFRTGDGSIATGAEIHSSLCYSRRTERFSIYNGSPTGGAGSDLIEETTTRYTARKGWVNLKLKMEIANFGSYHLKINNTTVLQGSADTARVTGVPYAKRIYFKGLATDGWNYDSIIIKDTSGSQNNDFSTNMLHVYRLRPNGDGATTNFTPSTGSINYVLVDDDAAPELTNYVSSSTDGHKDLYTLEDLSNVEEVAGCVCYAYAQNSGSGSSDITLRMRSSGGTEEDGPTGAQSLTAGSDKYIYDIFELEPGGAAWDESKVDNCQAGFVAGI